MKSKKKICVVVHSRANYGRIKSLMKAIKKHDDLKLQLIVGASAILQRYGNPLKVIKKDGFKPNVVLHSILEGETPVTMAKSTGIGIIELATHFENLKPDIVVTVADRFETMSTAIAASYMNIKLAHTQGGEITGSIDESVRHAITKLSHIHFPATDKARQNIIKMGENPDNVFMTGCPSLDLLNDISLELPEDILKDQTGVGDKIDINKPYIIVLQHPVTTEYHDAYKQIEITLKAIKRVIEKGMQVIFLWPNVDAGSADISKAIREFREENILKRLRFFKNFTPEDYGRLLNNCKCIVGNSSSGIREGGFLGVPCVNIGNRQDSRERSVNVIDVDHNETQIVKAVFSQIEKSRYDSSFLYGNGKSGELIADILSKKDFDIHKKLKYSGN